MKKNILKTSILSLSLLFFTNSAYAELQIINLPSPQTHFAKYDKTLFYALKNRQSDRSFATLPVDIADISALLWSANGVNRSNGKSTIPTASNRQDMLIYLLNDEGVWLYKPQSNRLEQKSKQNILTPPLSKGSAFTLAYVQDMTKGGKEAYGNTQAGSMYQNVELFCAATGLASVVRGGYSAEVEEQMKLPEGQRLIIMHNIGHKN